jgi:hypothetical protein
MHIADRPLNQVVLGIVGRQKEQRHPGVGGQPLLDGFGFMGSIVIDDHVEPRIPVR